MMLKIFENKCKDKLGKIANVFEKVRILCFSTGVVHCWKNRALPFFRKASMKIGNSENPASFLE